MSFERKSYHYTLPNELIAQEAVHPHHDARLLVVDRKTGEIEIETTFYNLNQIIPENRVIFFNNSRVIPSRLRLKNAEYKSKYSNGIIKDGEIFFLSQKDNNCIEALVKP